MSVLSPSNGCSSTPLTPPINEQIPTGHNPPPTCSYHRRGLQSGWTDVDSALDPTAGPSLQACGSRHARATDWAADWATVCPSPAPANPVVRARKCSPRAPLRGGAQPPAPAGGALPPLSGQPHPPAAPRPSRLLREPLPPGTPGDHPGPRGGPSGGGAAVHPGVAAAAAPPAHPHHHGGEPLEGGAGGPRLAPAESAAAVAGRGGDAGAGAGAGGGRGGGPSHDP
eukprot:538834-Prorocentrum_minimum.AAC.1